jgi:hypothetical protein
LAHDIRHGPRRPRTPPRDSREIPQEERARRLHIGSGVKLLAATLAIAFVAGCTGVIGEGSSSNADPGAATAGICAEVVPIAPLRRMTREQYARTVRDLLGVALDTPFVADDVIDGFEVGGTVSPLLEEQHVAAAESIASKIDPKKTIACDVAEDACLASFLRRAFRRPATGEEVARYRALYATAPGDDGVRLIVTAALLSPNFHYLRDVGNSAAAGSTVDLDGYALANRLSYFLWGSMPDDALFEAAESGALATKDALAREARRMVKDPKAKEAIASFHRQWLHLDGLDGLSRDARFYPEASYELGVSLKKSLQAFVTDAFEMGPGGLDAMLSGSHAFVDQRLATLLGVPGVSGDAFVRVSLDPTQRRGLITQPALMALLSKPSGSDPIHRGVFVRRQLLCQDLPPPPADVKFEIAEPSAGKSTRERFAEHRKNPTCASCHSMIDGVGFGLESYDALGRWRTIDQGVPVDAHGEVVSTDDADGTFEGGPELAEKLAKSAEVRTCIANKWTTFAMQRAIEAADRCGVEGLSKAFADSKGDFSELLVAITQLDAFRKGQVSP